MKIERSEYCARTIPEGIQAAVQVGLHDMEEDIKRRGYDNVVLWAGLMKHDEKGVTFETYLPDPTGRTALITVDEKLTNSWENRMFVRMRILELAKGFTDSNTSDALYDLCSDKWTHRTIRKEALPEWIPAIVRTIHDVTGITPIRHWCIYLGTASVRTPTVIHTHREGYIPIPGLEIHDDCVAFPIGKVVRDMIHVMADLDPYCYFTSTTVDTTQMIPYDTVTDPDTIEIAVHRIWKQMKGNFKWLTPEVVG